MLAARAAALTGAALAVGTARLGAGLATGLATAAGLTSTLGGTAFLGSGLATGSTFAAGLGGPAGLGALGVGALISVLPLADFGAAGTGGLAEPSPDDGAAGLVTALTGTLGSAGLGAGFSVVVVVVVVVEVVRGVTVLSGRGEGLADEVGLGIGATLGTGLLTAATFLAGAPDFGLGTSTTFLSPIASESPLSPPEFSVFSVAVLAAGFAAGFFSGCLGIPGLRTAAGWLAGFAEGFTAGLLAVPAGLGMRVGVLPLGVVGFTPSLDGVGILEGVFG